MDRMEKEGVIKFRLDFSEAPPVPGALVDEVNACRAWLYEQALIGQDPRRYGGYGFGNISRRLPPFDAAPEERVFLISGTQTGGLEVLGPEHYATVRACYPEQNRVVAAGPIEPSSESMTHGTLYALDGEIRYVIHVHSPELWSQAALLGLPVTRADVTYGTPAMAEEVRRLFRETNVADVRIFAMGGHEDGLVSFGTTTEEATAPLRRCLARLLVAEHG